MAKRAEKMNVILERVEDYVGKYPEVVVDTPATYEDAKRVLKEIKAEQKLLEGERKKMTAPLDESKRAIMDFFKTPKDLLASLESSFKSAMSVFIRAEEERRRIAEAEEREKQRKIEEELKAARKDKDPEKAYQLKLDLKKAAEVPKKEEVKLLYTKLWKVKIVDKALVPDEFKTVNEAALRKIAVESKGATEVPGVEFYQEKTVRT